MAIILVVAGVFTVVDGFWAAVTIMESSYEETFFRRGSTSLGVLTGIAFLVFSYLFFSEAMGSLREHFLDEIRRKNLEQIQEEKRDRLL